MNWSMPRPVLQLVAGVIGAASLGSFALGVATAPDRGRLPGERSGPVGEALQAADAMPLGEERIEGPPPPPELTEEEKAKREEEKKAREEAAAAAKAEAIAAAAGGALTPVPVAPAPTTEAAPPPPPPTPKAEEPVF